MPLFTKLEINKNSVVYLWKITETLDELFRAVVLKDLCLDRLESMKSEGHQKGFLAVRMILQHIGYTDFDLYYDEFGKPNLKDGTNISISHSSDFSAIALSDKKVGMDLEQIKDKVLRIAPRFMDVSHLNHLLEEQQVEKATVIWGIKESVFKLKNEKGISFPQHIFEEKFDLEDKKCVAQLRFNNSTEYFDVVFETVEGYAVVCAFEQQ
jgi:4'-phosphopantetheinyl transferase